MEGDAKPSLLAADAEDKAADVLPSVGQDMAAAEEPATNTNKKHVAVDITMHFKNHMSPNGDVSTALGTE